MYRLLICQIVVFINSITLHLVKNECEFIKNPTAYAIGIYKDLLKNEYELMKIGLDPKHWKKQIICFVQGKNIYPSNSVLSFNNLLYIK